MISPFAFLFGLILGSFLNVCIYRIPLGQSIVVPRSYCPGCGRFVRWYDNVPLLSYLWLKGRCRSCQKRISFQYPFVELLTGLLSLGVFLKFAQPIPYLFYFLFLTVPLVVMTFIDLRHQILPNILTLPGIATGMVATLLLSALSPLSALLKSLFGILAGGGALFIISWVYEKIRHHEGIGGGDVKLAAMLGAFFGWKEVFFILFLSSLLGSVVGLFLLVIFRRGLRYAIPFGPFLAGAALMNLFFGQQIIDWYLSLTSKLY